MRPRALASVRGFPNNLLISATSLAAYNLRRFTAGGPSISRAGTASIALGFSSSEIKSIGLFN